jgi:hypothetical protein
MSGPSTRTLYCPPAAGSLSIRLSGGTPCDPSASSGGASAPYPRRARRRPRRRRHHCRLWCELHRVGRQPRQRLQHRHPRHRQLAEHGAPERHRHEARRHLELDRRHHEHRLAGRRLRPEDRQPDRLYGAPEPAAGDGARLRRVDHHRPRLRERHHLEVQRHGHRPHQRVARQLRRRHQAPLQVHGHAAVEHRRHLPGQDGRRRLRLVGHPVLFTGTHTREGSAVSGGRALPWVLHRAL